MKVQKVLEKGWSNLVPRTSPRSQGTGPENEKTVTQTKGFPERRISIELGKITVRHGGGAFVILLRPGGWALAYPGATPGHFTHVFSN